MSNLAKIEEVYHAARESPPSEREAFLRDSCGDDAELRREVESLLAFEDQAVNFIETPPEDLAASLFRDGAPHHPLFEKRPTRELIGRNLSHYRIASMLGAGGMGEVYLAEDERLDRLVALKVLPPEFSENKERMGRFVREAKAASALNHPNIITIYEIAETDGVHFIAAEHIQGETLHRLLKQSPLDVQTVLDIAVQIASALEAAHRAGIIHRDLKPENIMVRPDGLVKVLDFGIAKLSEPAALPSGPGSDQHAFERHNLTTDTGMIIGTATYMSPEQAKGQPVDARSDIFSFGIVLYEMLTGKRAFDGETPLEIISSILKDEPALHELPPYIQAIADKMLRKNRAERYHSAGDLLADLKNVRRNLEFYEQPEGSGQLSREDSNTLLLSDSGARRAGDAATRSAQHKTPEIKQHRLGIAISIILLVLVGIGSWLFFLRASDQNETINSIAVLPFQNAGSDQNAEFLSDGIAETLINNFTKIPQLRVTARSTAFRFRGREGEPQTIGRELKVGAILTGRVSQIGESLSVQVDLIDAINGSQIWGSRYEGKASEIIDIEQQILRDVSARLRPEMSGAESQQAAKTYTQNAEAYQFYLRGRYYWNKRTADGLKGAIQEFKQAADLDPNYALPLVGLADCYVLLEEYSGMPAGKTLPQARAFATRALEIDDSLGEAHVSLGVINSQMWQWKEAEYHFKRAIELNSKYSTAYLWFCTYLRDTERFDEALSAIKQAQSLEPLSSIISVNVGIMHLVTEDADSAVKELERVIELDPTYWTARSWLGLAYLKQERTSEAFAELQKGVESSRRSNRALAFLGYAKAVTGNRSEALALVKELEEKYGKSEATILNIAMVYAGLGDKDRAFAWLQRNLESRSGESARIRWYPGFNSLRGDSRYQSLIRQMEERP